MVVRGPMVKGRGVIWGLGGLGSDFTIKSEVLAPLPWQIWWGMSALGVYRPKGPKYVKICTSFFCMAAVDTCRGSRWADGSSGATLRGGGG